MKRLLWEREQSLSSRAPAAALTPMYALVVHFASESELSTVGVLGLGLFCPGLAPGKMGPASVEWLKHLNVCAHLPLVLCLALSLAWSSSRNLARWHFLTFMSRLQQRTVPNLLLEPAHCRTTWELIHLLVWRAAEGSWWGFETWTEQGSFPNSPAHFHMLDCFLDASTWDRHCHPGGTG